ncbi:MAG: hypothetical protein IPF82_23395 [Blastocatellia bacterium]|nr:hypothetical protein [Blastocatellia bacterium]
MPYVISRYDVGPKFAARAIAHFKETGEPLMEYQRKRYKIVLGIESSFTSCGYALTDPTVEAEPSLTWRELAERAGCDVEDYAAEFNLEDDELDDVIPGEYFQERNMGIPVDGRAVAFDVVNGRIPGSWQYETPTDEEAPLGYVEVFNGPMVGSDYTAIEVSSEIALACLQRYLDREKAGIKIEP